MKTRRYSITKEQAEIIRLALTFYIDDLEEIIKTSEELGNSTMYERWRKAEAIIIHENLKNYKWEVQK